MLSVQSPGCAGMERLGTPGGPGGGGGADRQCHDLNDLSHMALQREVSRLMEIHARTRGVHNSEALNCPHRIPLPDGEKGQDRNLKVRVPYQQDELTQSAVKGPPNKTVQDAPDWAPPLPRKPPSPHKKDSLAQKDKKDSLVQKAYKYLAKFSGGKGAEAGAHAGTVTAAAETGAAAAGAGGGGGTGGAGDVTRQAPCVMVPVRPPPAPAPPPPAPPAPPSPPHAPPS